MITYPNCKINLGLRVLRRRTDGYHDLESIFIPVPWCDELEICRSDRFSFEQHGIDINTDGENNLVVKAYRMLCDEYPGRMGHVGIRLNKAIPFGAGLGGGSSDAAFTVKMLNELFSLNMAYETMCRLVARLGADCVFFLRNVPACVTGIGDCVEPLSFNPLSGRMLVMVKPEEVVSTPMAYRGVKPCDNYAQTLADALQQPAEQWKTCVFNDFESGVFAQYPNLSAIKSALYDTGAVYAAMSGSGSTLFGVYDADTDRVSLTDRLSVHGTVRAFRF